MVEGGNYLLGTFKGTFACCVYFNEKIKMILRNGLVISLLLCGQENAVGAEKNDYVAQRTRGAKRKINEALAAANKRNAIRFERREEAALRDKGMQFIDEENGEIIPQEGEVHRWLSQVTTVRRINFFRGVGIIFQATALERFQHADRKRVREFNDEGSDELTSLYLNYSLMKMGIRQANESTICCELLQGGDHSKEGKMRNFGKNGACGNPDIPLPFPAQFNFNRTVDKEGRSFLTRAVASNCLETVQMLIHRGAHVNCPDKRGILPLEEAFSREEIKGRGFYSDVIALLRACGAEC